MSSTPDGISSLPDDIICHILSFLPTKKVVATSVLYRCWKTEKPIFVLTSSCTLFCSSRHFVESFRLEITYDDPRLRYFDNSNVVKWVNVVVQCGVECLHLDVNTKFDMPKLPISILSCRTLVVLKFYGFIVEGFTSIVLPSLKTLHFEFVNFSKIPRDLLLLLAGCPILEDLQAAFIMVHSKETLTYQERKSLSLSKLTRAYMIFCYCYFPLTTLHNVEYLCIEIDKMYCPSDDIPTFHNLTHFELHSLNFKWHLLVEVLKHCPKLQNLDLNEAAMDGAREDVQENWVDPEVVPQCLSLQLKTCTLRNFLGLQGELLLARYILKNARVLQIMRIQSKEQLKTETSLSSCPMASPTCQLSAY